MTGDTDLRDSQETESLTDKSSVRLTDRDGFRALPSVHIAVALRMWAVGCNGSKGLIFRSARKIAKSDY